VRTKQINDVIEDSLRAANLALAKVMDAQVLLFRSTLLMRVDNAVRSCIEDLVELEKSEGGRKPKLCVVIETNGGFIEVVERIYMVFRQYYDEVVFVIPNFAYSAGTVLVLSGDEIYMDYYSVLGPIDPQMEGEDGNGPVPGIGYLVKFNHFIQKINSDPEGTNTRAEMAYLINKFDPAMLFFIEQAKDHAIELLKEWLPKHKFKDWKKTKTRNELVSDEMKKNRANAIAETLGNPERWHSHGRGIGIRDLESDEIKLVIRNFSESKELESCIKEYYGLAIDYFAEMKILNALHSLAGGVRRI
jgi:hypothetical protein